MWTDLGVTPMEGLLTFLSAAGIYIGFLLLIRLFGQRSVARIATIDLVIVFILGSVAGRVITGNTPTLAAGLIGLATLLALHTVAQRVARSRAGAFLTVDRSVVLMAGNELLMENLRRTRVSEEEVWAALRLAGVRNTGEVACVVLESAGDISVIRRGAPLERLMFEAVRGAERLPPELFSGAAQ
jgi:uncharacterized membrane protein YcaP (DUF421 family)